MLCNRVMPGVLVLGAALVIAAVVPRTVAAADRCLTGSSAATGATGAGDASEISAVRAAVEVACPCATASDRGTYLRCARGVIAARQAANAVRKGCVSVLRKTVGKSTCGYAPSPRGNPVTCVQKRVATGKVSCSIRSESTCVDGLPDVTRSACPDIAVCLDAADSDGDLLITSADSGACGSCGNGTVQSVREQCDGAADAACPGKCLGNCQCAVCGNGIIESPVEQCEGLTGACPGLCNADCTCPAVVGVTTDIPSGAQPPNTPGSPGVTVSNPKLLTQFGSSSFSLNNARYVRFHWDVPALAPQAILVLVPGFEGGGNDFKLLAENLLPRALENHGLVVEVWAFDRRTNQLEDVVGLDIAESQSDALVGLDWLFGSELGLTLHPALAAGPNRRAVFYNPNDDVPFLANWTNLVFSRDIDAVVTAARAAVPNNNVFLGGHSAGTGFTARYAATDFNLTGVGPADPGYARVKGLVLLEGAGASTGGTPLTADTLDRIEAKFDGGLFGAVRDNAPRCVDGVTPCTIATEAVDCAGLPSTKCTPPTPSYAVSSILNARILAAVEPVAIQGITDPDGGQIILQADQGAPGNNALAKVPDLGTLAILPKSTVKGGLGSFVDDDGTIAAVASFVATSVGAAGPSVGGLVTWLDVTEGPLPLSALPNNGAAPSALPGGAWGQEKEVTRFDRFLTTFYAGGSNFTDWYYPSAGPSTTSVTGVCTTGICTVGNVGTLCSSNSQCSQSINLDSSALSIGRNRRDIENLTQAASINVPVIGFGGTNGLVPVPGRFVAFAQSIGPCTAPSCTGSTPRVVDAAMPNPAFPTFGDVAGGFEVYMSEGFAHVDVLTAEDNPDNNVLTPLAAFLARNSTP